MTEPTIVRNDSSGRLQVLMVLNNAPDYREPFLRELSRSVDLTVVARPCEPDNLMAPVDRVGYRYHELPGRRLAGLVWQPGLASIVSSEAWDIICSSINMRDPGRLNIYFRNRRLHARWVWWGHVFGRTSIPGLERLRGSIIRSSAGVLAFNPGIAESVRNEFGVPSASFNNTQVRTADFRPGQFRGQFRSDGTELTDRPDRTDEEVRFLFVGRYQPRKRIERLINLVARDSAVSVRLVGPGMEQLSVPADIEQSGRLQRFGRTVGAELEAHFDWADLVANPGHVGLLVMNAAQHGKGIVIDSSSEHAPEYWLAGEAEQPFIDFSDDTAVDAFVHTCKADPSIFHTLAERLQMVARERYTIEHMAQVHLAFFRSTASRHEE